MIHLDFPFCTTTWVELLAVGTQEGLSKMCATVCRCGHMCPDPCRGVVAHIDVLGNSLVASGRWADAVPARQGLAAAAHVRGAPARVWRGPANAVRALATAHENFPRPRRMARRHPRRRRR